MPNNIDPTRLSAIFKTLSATESLKSQRQNNEQATKGLDNTPATNLKKIKKSDREELKKKLKYKLTKIKSEEGNFEDNAKRAAVREVLFWEFGEDFINHPEFKQINKKILDQINNNDKLQSALLGMIKDLLR